MADASSPMSGTLAGAIHFEIAFGCWMLVGRSFQKRRVETVAGRANGHVYSIAFMKEPTAKHPSQKRKTVIKN